MFFFNLIDHFGLLKDVNIFSFLSFFLSSSSSLSVTISSILNFTIYLYYFHFESWLTKFTCNTDFVTSFFFVTFTNYVLDMLHAVLGRFHTGSYYQYIITFMKEVINKLLHPGVKKLLRDGLIYLQRWTI